MQALKTGTKLKFGKRVHSEWNLLRFGRASLIQNQQLKIIYRGTFSNFSNN